jgi:hypothetical protein
MVYGVTNGQQAYIVHHYKNTKQKLPKSSGSVTFDQMCRFNHFMPIKCEREKERKKGREE